METVHGSLLLETNVEVFLKFGLGDAYYEYTKPVYNGWDEEKNRNSFNIDLDWLTALKQALLLLVPKALYPVHIYGCGARSHSNWRSG